VAIRMEQQVALKSDALATESKLARAEVSRTELGTSVETRKEQLNQLMGRDVRTPFTVSAMPDAIVPALSVEAAQARAIETRPDVKQARIAAQQAELARRVARTGYIPEVNVAASYLA